MISVERTARQAALAELWNVSDVESLLALLIRAPAAREHELVHALHEQAVDCHRTAPEVASQLDRIAGWLAEVHAGLRAAEAVESVRALLQWQTQAPWRGSRTMASMLGAVAASSPVDGAWPWSLDRLPALQIQLDDLLLATRRLAEVDAAERRRRLEGDSRLQWPELTAWLSLRKSLPDADARAHARAHDQLVALQRLRTPDTVADPRAQRRLEVSALAELVELWYRLDPVLDRTCEALRAEVVAGQRSLADALRTVGAGADDPARGLHRRSYFLHHLLEEQSVSMRRAALMASARLVMSREALGLDRIPRAQLVHRWASALELHWTALPEPPVALDAALRAVDQILTTVADGSAPRLARDLLCTRARLLRRLVGWREDQRPEAIRAYNMALEALSSSPDDAVEGRCLAELAGLQRSRRAPDAVAHDRKVRAAYDDALSTLDDSVVIRARVLAEYAVYLARPRSAADEDAEHALAMAEQAVTLVESLPQGVREHPVIQADAAGHRLTLGNVRLEVGLDEPDARRHAAAEDYRRALDHVDGGDELLSGLVHLDLACLSLSSIPRARREEHLAEIREALEAAVQGLTALPVAHARAVTERAMLAVQAAPRDTAVRERGIREVEAALHRLPLGIDAVVRARAQHQLGALILGRDAHGDVARAAEHFVAARAGFVEGGAGRLAVEAARDYAESQLRVHADEGEPAALVRGAVVLEQAALLAEQRWAARSASDRTEELIAMLDGVHGDLAWFQAKLGRPSSVLAQTVSRAKRFRAHPSLRALRARAGRSAMLSPAHLDPLARRLPPAPREPRREAKGRGPTAVELEGRLAAFARANPSVVVIDITLTRWGTVVLVVSEQGLQHVALPLTRERVRRWVWGDAADPGWWSRYLAFREAEQRGRPRQAREREQAWVEASNRLVADLGGQLLEPIIGGLKLSLEGRVVLLAPGRLTGVPLGAARLGGKALAQRVGGLAQVSSLLALPAGPLPSPRPRRALCVLANPEAEASETTPLEELGDVVRLLASAQVDVEVMARQGGAVGEAAYSVPAFRTRERVTVAAGDPTVDEVLKSVGAVDHLFYGGHGRTRGLVLLDAVGRSARLDASAIGRGPRWAPASSVFVSAATHVAPPVDDAAAWSLVDEFHRAGVGFVVIATGAIPQPLAREVSRGVYLYWALGKSLPEAYCAALSSLGGFDLARIAAFVVAMGDLSGLVVDDGSAA